MPSPLNPGPRLASPVADTAPDNLFGTAFGVFNIVILNDGGPGGSSAFRRPAAGAHQDRHPFYRLLLARFLRRGVWRSVRGRLLRACGLPGLRFFRPTQGPKPLRFCPKGTRLGLPFL